MLPTFLLVPWLCPTREYFNIIQRFQLGKIPLSEKVKHEDTSLAQIKTKVHEYTLFLLN